VVAADAAFPSTRCRRWPPASSSLTMPRAYARSCAGILQFDDQAVRGARFALGWCRRRAARTVQPRTAAAMVCAMRRPRPPRRARRRAAVLMLSRPTVDLRHRCLACPASRHARRR
jgi:hypothetical protein